MAIKALNISHEGDDRKHKNYIVDLFLWDTTTQRWSFRGMLALVSGRSRTSVREQLEASDEVFTYFSKLISHMLLNIREWDDASGREVLQKLNGSCIYDYAEKSHYKSESLRNSNGVPILFNTL